MRWVYVRLILAALTIFTTTNIIFFLIRLMPGNIVDYEINYYVGEMGWTSEEAYEFLSAAYGLTLDKPFHEQYLSFMANIFTGELGRSLRYGQMPVINIVATAIPWTVFTVSISLFASFLLGIVCGIFTAYRHGSKSDKALTVSSIVVDAIPNYVIAYFLLILLASEWDIFPMALAYDVTRVKPGFNLSFVLDVLWHATLPVISYTVSQFAGWALMMRSTTVSVLGEDYVFAAEARGLKGSKIMWKYVGRNAMLPMFTLLAIRIGHIFGGSTLIENVFSYPGMGKYIADSISTRDYPIMQGLFFIIAVSVTLSNLLGDLLYARLDPRVRLK